MSYKQGLIQDLTEQGLMSEELQKAIQEFKPKNDFKPQDKLTFGKYKGKKITEIAEFDRKYLEWTSKQSWCFDDLKEQIETILK